MDPFVVDPKSYLKATAVVAAREYADAFLRLNKVKPVKEYIFQPDDSKKPPGGNPWHGNGWYWNGTVFVNLKRSRTPVKTPAFQWSYTGYKADLTAPGILTHEVGHHIHFTYEASVSPAERKALIARIKEVARVEPAVSGYEPNPYEVFAEAARLFMLNPSLLSEGRPKRFELIRSLGLQPPHNAPWRQVLGNAHERLINAAVNWVGKR